MMLRRPSRTWDWPRTRRYDELSNRPDPSSSRQFCPDYIIATSGYDFREGQGAFTAMSAAWAATLTPITISATLATKFFMAPPHATPPRIFSPRHLSIV